MRMLFLSAFLVLLCAKGQAQMGTMKWKFNSRAQVTKALGQTRGDLRATYNVLICAGRQGYTNTGIGYYEKIVDGKEFSASGQDSAAYAFAYDLGYSFRPWGWKRDTDQSMIKKSSGARAQLFRERAKSLLPNSPERMVMRAFWAGSLQREERQEAYALSLQSVKLAPKWADAYFWLGEHTSGYANIFSTQITRKQIESGSVQMKQTKAKLASLGQLQLRAYDKAEALDPGLRPHLYWPRIGAYQRIRDKKSARMIPILSEKHLKAFPQFGDWYRKSFGRSVQQWRHDNTNLAAEIMAEQ